MNEVWKDVKGYEGLYQVSNLGRVKSLDRWINQRSNSKKLIKSKMLKPMLNKRGYLMVGLSKKRKRKEMVYT